MSNLSNLDEKMKSEVSRFRSFALWRQIIIGICILAGLATGATFLYKLWKGPPKIDSTYKAPPPAAGMPDKPTGEVQLKPTLKTYDKVKAAKKMDLPPEIVSDPKKELVATGEIKSSETGYKIAAITDINTGETSLVMKEKEQSLFDFGGKTEIGSLIGASTSGNMAIIYARQEMLRIGSVHLAVIGGAGATPDKMGVGAFINAYTSW